MRRIIVFDNVTADGFFSDAKGGLDWVVQDPDLMAKNGAAAAGSASGGGTVLFGRRTYDMFAAVWPNVKRGSPGPHGEPFSPEMLAMADMLNHAEKLVWSRMMKEPAWQRTRVLRSFDAKEVEALKAQPGRDIMVFGSGSLVAQLAEHGLVDEYQLQVSPIALGQGKSLFAELPRARKLRLLEATPYPRTGVVVLRYADAPRVA